MQPALPAPRTGLCWRRCRPWQQTSTASACPRFPHPPAPVVSIDSTCEGRLAVPLKTWGVVQTVGESHPTCTQGHADLIPAICQGVHCTHRFPSPSSSGEYRVTLAGIGLVVGSLHLSPLAGKHRHPVYVSGGPTSWQAGMHVWHAIEQVQRANMPAVQGARHSGPDCS